MFGLDTRGAYVSIEAVVSRKKTIKSLLPVFFKS